MMKNFKYVAMMAAALTLGLSSCSNNDDLGNGETIDTGRPTKMTLAITQPTTYATDGNATAAEVDIKTVDVYIYSGSTFIKRENFKVDDGDFVQDSTDPAVWKLATGKEITTTTGAKNIYVGVNLSEELAGKIAGTNPGTFAQTVASAAALNSDGFAMFSRTTTTADLVATDATDYDTKNTVSTTVARLLAKVVVKEKSSSATVAPEGKFHNLKFTVHNVNTKFFPLPSATFVDPNHESQTVFSDFIKGTSYTNVNKSTVTDPEDIKAIYTTENTSLGDLQGDHTYVHVEAAFVPTTINGWVGENLTTEADINPGDIFYRVIVEGKNYYFSDKDQATAYASAKTGTLTEYIGGLSYYNVFLNPNPAKGENKFDVLRNTIYTVNITKINGLGEGKDVAIDPEVPIVAPTNLSVEIDIEDWSTNDQDSELTGK
ncbi:Mfa1 family fimbria major subunit [Bacteroides reticulotermitis]|uniref:Lipoprotein n=2 Tax=Bacteroides reticulotermitis TaxID=1133319 RepID=W4V1N0_9BACE|nr:Mfa1 family fimbria major subunit [Bacteroides reticulotermitis]MBB4042488.1 hypothetical protein [Bacteroides reticulotermitis]GAE86649.1 lipoprotein [Bacteroides reticulotermitis JCM 10512]